jgi:cytochrome c biogenesis protein CcmG/thiol:disulfide interchange protein DsbE
MTPTTSKRSRKRHPALLAGLLAGGASALVACGGGASDPDNSAAAPDYSAAIEAAPAPLASLYADGGVVLDGGLAAYEDQIAALEGYPIVVNKWASWCGPCRAEFPHLQNQAAEHADEVAFLGVDTDDSAAAAETFLRDNPVPYPSISDPDKEIATSLGAIEFPSTIFYDDQGEIAYLRRGVYATEEELAADIERYALDG